MVRLLRMRTLTHPLKFVGRSARLRRNFLVAARCSCVQVRKDHSYMCRRRILQKHAVYSVNDPLLLLQCFIHYIVCILMSFRLILANCNRVWKFDGSFKCFHL